MACDMLSFYPPKPHRMHEVCGPGAPFFAFALAARIEGEIMWVCEHWGSDQINPASFSNFVSPHHVLTILVKDQLELLAVAEEVLRSGVVKLVVLEVSKPLDLTVGRRLQLAARDGQAMALVIIPQDMGSNAAETRWQCAPEFESGTTYADSTLQQWQLIKNKSGTLGTWYVQWQQKTHRIIVVSSSRERQGSQVMAN